MIKICITPHEFGVYENGELVARYNRGTNKWNCPGEFVTELHPSLVRRTMITVRITPYAVYWGDNTGDSGKHDDSLILSKGDERYVLIARGENGMAEVTPLSRAGALWANDNLRHSIDGSDVSVVARNAEGFIIQ